MKLISRHTALILAVTALFFVGCGKEQTTLEPIPTSDGTYTSMTTNDLEQFRLPRSGDTVITLSTNMGDIQLLLFPEAAPKAVENFITLGSQGYYDGVLFHRVIDDFMIQGGDPEGTGMGGQSMWGTPFEDEFDDRYFPYRGALAMANAGPNTNGSQFFIVQTSSALSGLDETYDLNEQMGQAYEALGGTQHLFKHHTVFGHVVGGMDVVDAIAKTPIDKKNKPLEDVVIEDFIITVID